MDGSNSELHLELLLGTRVHDVNGRVAGRIEEFRVDQVDGEWVVTEFHLGASAWFERLAIAAGQLPILSRLPLGRRAPRRARWDQIDFDDRGRPRLLVAATTLATVEI